MRDFKKPSRAANNTPDRLPPHSAEAEKAVLGCVLLDPPLINECIEKLRQNGKEFYDLRHQTIYETMIELNEDGIPIDTISLQERLKCWEKLDQVGGITYLMSLPENVPSALNLKNYIDIVLEKFSLRRMIHACTDVVSRIYDNEGDVPELLDSCEAEILQISESRVTPNDLRIQTLVNESIQDFESYLSHSGEVSGITTGFVDLDKMTDGFHQGEMIVIAARPSMGKTSLLLNIVDHIAVDLNLPVGVFSLEMTGRQLVKSMICSRARVNMRNIRDGFLHDADFPKLTTASGAISHSQIYIDDTAGQSILQIRAKARRMKQQHDIKMIGIDYLQLANADGGGRRFDNRQQEVSIISSGIKNLAKELKIPVVVLCQLNRDIEREKNRKPRMSDLRESGSIEQDADLIGFLYKPQSDIENDDESDFSVPTNLLIAKQRQGPTGDVRLTFLKEITRFESAAKLSDEDIPDEHQSHPPQEQFTSVDFQHTPEQSQ